MNEHLLMRRDRGGGGVGTGDYLAILFYCTTPEYVIEIKAKQIGKVQIWSKNGQSTNVVSQLLAVQVCTAMKKPEI